MVTPQPFKPRPLEVVLANHLNLPHDQVVAGSFEVTEATGLVRWSQQVDEQLVQRTVKLDRYTLGALVERAKVENECPGSRHFVLDMVTKTPTLVRCEMGHGHEGDHLARRDDLMIRWPA